MRAGRFSLGAVAVLLLLGGVHDLAAQNVTRPPKCDTPEFRQFDFWIGSWDVTSGGNPAGTSLITLEEDGCVIHEHWKGAKGGTGQSFNFFDRTDGKWHQMWVSNSGNVLYLTGNYGASALTLQGESRRQGGAAVLNRLTFTANPDHTVRQLWETSSNGGKTWAAAFDGLYRKREQ